MDCPKCNSEMQEMKIETLHGQVIIDKCNSCKGLWFDNGEAEQLKGGWMADFADSGDPTIGKTYNTVRDIKCPRCGKPMTKLNDPKQGHIEYEACAEHGMFMDAGEFTDYKHETLLDIFRDAVASLKRSQVLASDNLDLEMPSGVIPDGIFYGCRTRFREFADISPV